MSSHYLETQDDDSDQSVEQVSFGDPNGNEREERGHVAAPVEDPPHGGGQFQFEPILRRALRGERASDIYSSIHHTRYNTPVRTVTQESTVGVSHRRPLIQSSVPGEIAPTIEHRESPVVKIGRFVVNPVKEPLFRWTYMKNIFRARIPPFRSYQCFFCMALVFFFALAWIFSWLIHDVCTDYMVRDFEFEFTEQIISAERDMDMRNA